MSVPDIVLWVGHGPYPEADDYIKAIELVNNKRMILEPLMTMHFPFEDYNKAYKYIDDKKDKVMKVFIDVNKEFNSILKF
ncbi:hypothetical protein LCGC14_2373690 [marine sediment metagenome]|uniref:Alcohol dehydrogenase-like C-terminal domain-containing protein n=1 Tax=marine sediment metagenome TaxID=412755 RepID=A0A0F9EFD2_9ZZZZ